MSQDSNVIVAAEHQEVYAPVNGHGGPPQSNGHSESTNGMKIPKTRKPPRTSHVGPLEESPPLTVTEIPDVADHQGSEGSAVTDPPAAEHATPESPIIVEGTPPNDDHPLAPESGQLLPTTESKDDCQTTDTAYKYAIELTAGKLVELLRFRRPATEISEKSRKSLKNKGDLRLRRPLRRFHSFQVL